MPSISEPYKYSFYLPSGKPAYDIIFEKIKAGLIERFPPEITYRKPDFRYSNRNRMQIMLDRIQGSHYQITFRQDYFEFALHFESTALKSLERRQAFDPYLPAISTKVGSLVKSGPRENKGWMGVWYERRLETFDQEKILIYIDQYSRFIDATFPILVKLYE